MSIWNLHKKFQLSSAMGLRDFDLQSQPTLMGGNPLIVVQCIQWKLELRKSHMLMLMVSPQFWAHTTPFVSLPSGRRFGSRATISTLILLSETWRFWWLAPVVQETVGVEVRGREAPKCVWCDKFELCTTFLCLQRCLGTRGVTPRPAGSVGWCWGPGGTPGTTGGRNIARWGVWLCSEQILGS